MPIADLFRQLSLLVGLPAAVAAVAAAAVIVIVRDWRAVLFSYALYAIMLTLLLSQVIPSAWALLQAVVSGLVAVMLFLSARQLRGSRKDRRSSEARWPAMASLTGFRLLVVALAVAAFLLAGIEPSLPVVDPVLGRALVWLVGMGLLGLALHEEPLHAGLSLLILLGGAELFVFALIQRRMLVGVLLGGQLLIGLAVAYLMLAHEAEPVAADAATGEESL